MTPTPVCRLDEDTVLMWTVECLESIKDRLSEEEALPIMSKIIWAIAQAYYAGRADGEDTEKVAHE